MFELNADDKAPIVVCFSLGLTGEFSGKIIEGSSGVVDYLKRKPFSNGFISLVVSSEACKGDNTTLLAPFAPCLALRYFE